MYSKIKNEKLFFQEDFLSINNESKKEENDMIPNRIELASINEEDKENILFLNTTESIIEKIEDKKKCKINIKKIIVEIITIIYNITSFIFYKKSLEGCFLSQSECIPLLSTMFLGRIVIYGVLASLMTTIEIYLIIFKVIKCYHLLYIIIFYIIMYNHDHGTKLDYHGLYNIIIFFIVFIIFFLIIGFIIIIIISIKKKNKISLIIILAIILYIIIKLSLFFINIKNSCDDWDKGLNSTRIDNSIEYECTLIYPKKCLLFKINNYFDLSKFVKSCSPNYNHEKDLKHFLRYLKVDENLKLISSLKHFGYPITVNNPIFNKNNPEEYYNLGQFVMKNIILMDLYNNKDKKYYNDSILKPEVEVIYDKKKKKRKIEINLIKNESLSIERTKIEKNPNNQNISLFKNIMIIYIDCISRQHFLRVMKKTSSFIKQFMKYDNDLGFSSYEFMRYQAFCHWTNPNIIPMFYSSHINYKNVHIIKYLKENGYITAQSQNMCSKESFEIDPDYIHMSDLEIDEYDHENIAMFCEPNYAEIDNPTPVFTGPYGILRRCLAGFDSFNYMIEYGKQFWQKYKGNKKYLRLNFQDAHEFTGQVVKYLDEPLFNFLNNLYKTNDLKDTALFFISDHGNSYFNYFYYYVLKSDDSLIERGFATLFIILPNYKNNKSEELLNNINIKQQAFITPFDIHDTIMHIAYGDNLQFNNILYSKKGNSLITNFEYKTRKCENWFLYFKANEDCICLNGFGNKKIVNRFPKKN